MTTLKLYGAHIKYPVIPGPWSLASSCKPFTIDSERLAAWQMMGTSPNQYSSTHNHPADQALAFEIRMGRSSSVSKQSRLQQLLSVARSFDENNQCSDNYRA